MMKTRALVLQEEGIILETCKREKEEKIQSQNINASLTKINVLEELILDTTKNIENKKIEHAKMICATKKGSGYKDLNKCSKTTMKRQRYSKKSQSLSVLLFQLLKVEMLKCPIEE